MPTLFDETLKNMPEEQKEKLANMVKIWEKGNTFPADMLADFQKKLNGETVPTGGKKTFPGSGQVVRAPIPTRPLQTPVGWPPQRLYDEGLIKQSGGQQNANGTPAAQNQAQPAPAQHTPQQQAPAPAPAPAQDVNSILAALANLPKATSTQPPPQPAAPQPVPSSQQQSGPAQLPPNLAALFGQNGMPPLSAFPPQPQQQPPYSTPQPTQPFQMPQGFPGFPPQPPPSIPQQYPQAPPPPVLQQAADPLAPLRGILPQNILNDQAKLVDALKLLQDLQKDGIPMDKWGPVIEAFESQHAANPPARGAYDSHSRQRSRSPDRNAARRRASPVYGAYDGNQGDSDRYGRSRYRQRSPMRNSPIPMQMSGNNMAMNGQPMQPKYIAIDNSLPRDNIKVLSRTLFVGGASGSQQEIQDLFERFGRVQTCIANRDKRHAFVKMTTRSHALSAKENMERLQGANDREVMSIARQTKWGVGFGPRECCNYQKGESIIPIDKLTDADMKWLLTAEFGGTGGQKVEGGMVLEEPDIEIGAGVSSKAMSKRVMPDAGPPSNKRQHRDEGRNNNNSGGSRGGGGGGGRRQDGQQGGGYGGYGGYSGGGAMPQQPPPVPMQMEAYGYARPEPVAVATPPAVPGFGGFALPQAGGGQAWGR